MSVRYDFFTHPSGDVFAVEYDAETQKFLRTCGPLHYSEVITEHLPDFEYSSEDAEWLDNEENVCLLTEPSLSQWRIAMEERGND